MRLVDRGPVDLDAPARAYVPAFRLSDPDVADSVTVRRLLAHTSGIIGDHLPDRGRGDDVLERYVATLASLPMLHAPGEMFSYGNSGFVVAGRLVEEVTGQTWDAALRTRLLDPLGSAEFATLPEEALRYRVAVGHLPAATTPGWRVRCGRNSDPVVRPDSRRWPPAVNYSGSPGCVFPAG